MMTSQQKLLVDETAARELCRSFYLPPPSGPRLLICMARKKYANKNEWQGGGMVILERKVLYFHKGQESEDTFILELQKIQAIAEAGLYTLRGQGQKRTIPLEWLAVYTTAYPLNEDDAGDMFVQKVLHIRQEQRRAHDNNKEREGLVGLLSQMKTCLHQCPDRHVRLLKLAIDTKDEELILQLQAALQGAIIRVAMETRGGYHIVLEKGPWCKPLYDLAREVNAGVAKEDQWLTIEDSFSPMLAIAGTCQGGFVVRLVTESWQASVSI